MSNPSILDQDRETGSGSPTNNEPNESFGDILSQYEQSHSHKAEQGAKGLEGTVVAVTGEQVFLDIGYKIEGIIPLAEFQKAGEAIKAGDKVAVSIKGRGEDGYYELSKIKVDRPKDWSSLEKAFADKAAIAGTITAVVKGGVSVDVGVRAFMPASRSGAKDAAEMEKLIGQEIRCRIIKLDVADEDVVVDRRAILEEEERSAKEKRYSEVKEGEIVTGEIRSLTDYGAFVDIGGIDALLHVADISWGRVNKPADVLTVGEQVQVKILKVDPAKRRISLGMKQLLPHPWEVAGEKYKQGERVQGTVTRVAEFGAFVELEKGIEGLIHLSEMSWSKKARKPSDVVKPGDTVDVVILGVNPADRRISLGLKQALGDPWAEVQQKFPAGSIVEGPVTSLTKFGAFVQVAEGVEGMIHVGDISAEKRINAPSDVLKAGQVVKALVLECDMEKRRMRLGMKQLVPTSLDEYIAEHKEGDVVTGRMIDASGNRARVELGEGIQANCRLAGETQEREEKPADSKVDLSSLSTMLQSKWKGGQSTGSSKREPARAGQIRSFRIVKLDPAAKKIELELA
ncbi:MAG TPA: 30S ribosomal protein S1 [Candidatus Sulfopaludibacter sp.]|jgi:small subunit ribosomal protein S1|nr:30S ribosomal protein S1 [Candidatus Sulfopaludibacter sp.]